MDTLPETTEYATRPAHPAGNGKIRAAATPSATERLPSVLLPWLEAQAINVTRHAAELRPFQREEFGTGPAMPSEGHLQAANELIASLRTDLLKLTKQVSAAVDLATREPSTAHLQEVVVVKERAHMWVHGI